MLPFYLIQKVPVLESKLRQMYRERAEQIFPRIAPYISVTDQVLDIGCGTGSIIQLVRERKKCGVSLVDVQHNAMCDEFPVTIYDGRKLPFEDDQFSVSLLITVLHHAKKPGKVLDEAMRVTSGKIIVVEDVFDDFLSRAVTFAGDCLLNWEIHSPFTNQTRLGWERIFGRKKLKIVDSEEFSLRCVGFPFKLAVFVLEKGV
jgi:SAM-dependent methyltransferase